MKLMKRMTALFLCFLMLSSGPVSTFAQSDVSGNDDVVMMESTVQTENAEVCEECGSSDVHTETCSFNTNDTPNTEAPAETTEPEDTTAETTEKTVTAKLS